MDWLKKNKWKGIIPVLLVLVLAVAFWIGGSAPGLQGWTVEPTDTAAAEPSETPGQSPSVSPSELVEEETTEPEPAESETPSETAPGAADAETDPSPSPTILDTQESGSSAQEKPDGAAAAAAASPASTAGGVTEPSASQGMEINPATGKDKYQTDPVPEGKPLPVEPQDASISNTTHTCTLSISCSTILDHMDWLEPEKVELVPEDGWILRPVQVTFYEGESVFNVFQRTCKQQKIHMEFSNTPMYNSAYIEGIHNLYEKDCGELSGWMYKVNEWFPNYGVSRYQLQDGDVICFVYTCDLGKDVGGSSSVAS